MKLYIKKLLRESLISEVSDEVYELIKNKYSKSRIHAGIESKDEFIEYRPSVQPNRPGYKPKGFWYGFGTSWLDWVRSEMPEWESENAFLVDIDDSKILKIRTSDELLAFHEKYSKDMMPGYGEEFIDWGKVAVDYPGIEIAPYLWDMRNDSRVPWYYTWDVPSGCIWGYGVIKKIERIN